MGAQWKQKGREISALKRGQLFGKLAKEIIVAAKAGGADPHLNARLYAAIEAAKKQSVPRDTIERAVKKGAGLTGEVINYELITYEGFAPHKVPVIVECLTDNRARTAPEMRNIFTKAGCSLGAAGCVAYMFSPKGVLLVAKDKIAEDALMEAALDAGAEDVADQGEVWQILTEANQLHHVREALAAKGVEIQSAELTKLPSLTVPCDGETARKVLKLIETLEDNEDVQKVYANFDIPDEVFASLET